MDPTTTGQDDNVFTLPMSPREIIDAGRQALSKPEELPTFPAVVVAVDRFMARVPWWVVMLGTAGLMWYAGPRRKAP